MERDSTKNSVQDARESLNSARDAFDAKQREVDPLQQGRKQQGDAQRSFQQEYRDLEARSEAELDAKVGLSSPLSPAHTLFCCIQYSCIWISLALCDMPGTDSKLRTPMATVVHVSLPF